jgi:hypothetical protein
MHIYMLKCGFWGQSVRKDNTDSDDDELGQESKLALEGSPLAPSIDSPHTSSEGWLRMLAESSNTLEEAYTPTKEEVNSSTPRKELPLDLTGTMMTKQPSMISSDWESNG